MDSAISRWKFANTTAENADPKPTLAQYDTIRNDWRSRDKVVKFVELFSSKRFQTDWCAAQPNETLRDIRAWKDFLEDMRTYSKPTTNPTLKNFKFRDLQQNPQETLQPSATE